MTEQVEFGITRLLHGDAGAGVNGAYGSEDLLSPRDRGFTLGDGLFETVLVHHGVPFMLSEHLARMSRSAGAFGIPFPPNVSDEVVSLIADGVKAVGAERDFALRLTLSRGIQNTAGLVLAESPAPTLVASLLPIHARAAGSVAQPLRVAIAAGRRNEWSPSAGHKVTAYADAILELRRAHAEGGHGGTAGVDDCIFLDTAGHVSEATASNVFIHDGEVLVTPALTCGALPGITRGVVLAIAAEMGVRAEERVVEVEELVLAQEVFLTSSLRGISSVGTVGGRSTGAAAPGPVTAAIIARYEERLQNHCTTRGA